MLITCIDKGEVQRFGVANLASLELNEEHKAPWCCCVDRISLLDFAAWRGRDSFVSALVAAGANPALGVLDLATFERLPKAYVAWLARAAAHLRRRGKCLVDHAVCACGEKAQVIFAPCGHGCCERCPWRSFGDFGFGELPELLCPLCVSAFQEDTITSFSEKRKGILRYGPLPASDPGWICNVCGCLNPKEWCRCINCNFSIGYSPCAANQRESKEFSRVVSILPSWLRTPWLRAWRRRQTFLKWQTLPNKVPQDVEERLALQAALESRLPGSDFLCSEACFSFPMFRLLGLAARSGSHTLTVTSAANTDAAAKPKQAKRLAGAFRALGPAEVARERLGITQQNRSERFRAAAEVGDSRRVMALLDAGVDVDSCNEYGQTPLFLAAFEGHLQVVKARYPESVLQFDLTVPAVASCLGRRSCKAVLRRMPSHECSSSTGTL